MFYRSFHNIKTIYSQLNPVRDKKAVLDLFVCQTRFKSSDNKIRLQELKKTLLGMSQPVPKQPKKFREAGSKRNKGGKYPASHISLQVLGSGAHGVPPSLYVFTGQQSYLFNCGEGSQRLAQENKAKLITVDNLFVTHKSWRNVGGIPGMLLTMQDMQDTVKDITLHGPPGIHSLYTDTKNFMNFKFISIKYNFYSDNDGTFGSSDQPLTIKAVPILAQKDGDTTVPVEYVLLQESVANEGIRGEKRVSSPEVTENKKSRHEEFNTDMAVAYICRTDAKLGKLCLESCVKAGVPPGPLLGELKSGKDITLTNGSVVKAKDVTEPDDPGAVFVVVEAPSLAHMKSLVEHPSFIPHQKNSDPKHIAQVVIHFTPPDVMASPEYREWSARFPSTTTHIVINEQNNCTGSEAILRHQLKLNYLNPKLFPSLHDESIPECSAEEKKIEIERSDSMPGCENVVKGKTSLAYHIRPNTKLSTEHCISLDTKQINTEIESSNCAPYQNTPQEATQTEEFPLITFLGTGSCMPNKTRNTSGILLQTQDDSYMMLDCGEGTYGQMVRMMGQEAAYSVLRKLKGVYVSHLHADHHLGFINLMLHRRKALLAAGIKPTSIPLLAPKNIVPYLCSYNNIFEEIHDTYSFVDNIELIDDSAKPPTEAHKELYDKLNLSSVLTCRVEHCKNAVGVAMTTLSGKKIVYSGDTRPCERLVDLGRDCDILIHEATLEDSLVDEAKMKMHSTVSEALSVAKKMRAQYTILTHFSQRYAKIPMLPSDGTEKVCIAYDFMKVRPSDLAAVTSLYPEFKKMFADAVQEVEMKNAKRMNNLYRDEVIKEELRKKR